MKYQPGDMSKFLMGSDARRVCTLFAASRLARARVLVGYESGETAASGRLVHGIGGPKNDRVRVSVTFAGAAVQQQWGRGKSRFLTRAFEGK